MDLLIMASVPALMLFLALFLFSDKKKIKLIEGGIYSIKNNKGQYGMMKLLKIDDQILHCLIYRQLFEKRPQTIDIAVLKRSPRYRRIPRNSIGNWFATLMGKGRVLESELEHCIS